jgi:hypothetical protein
LTVTPDKPGSVGDPSITPLAFASVKTTPEIEADMDDALLTPTRNTRSRRYFCDKNIFRNDKDFALSQKSESYRDHSVHFTNFLVSRKTDRGNELI